MSDRISHKKTSDAEADTKNSDTTRPASPLASSFRKSRYSSQKQTLPEDSSVTSDVSASFQSTGSPDQPRKSKDVKQRKGSISSIDSSTSVESWRKKLGKNRSISFNVEKGSLTQESSASPRKPPAKSLSSSVRTTRSIQLSVSEESSTEQSSPATGARGSPVIRYSTRRNSADDLPHKLSSKVTAEIQMHRRSSIGSDGQSPSPRRIAVRLKKSDLHKQLLANSTEKRSSSTGRSRLLAPFSDEGNDETTTTDKSKDATKQSATKLLSSSLRSNTEETKPKKPSRTVSHSTGRGGRGPLVIHAVSESSGGAPSKGGEENEPRRGLKKAKSLYFESTKGDAKETRKKKGGSSLKKTKSLNFDDEEKPQKTKRSSPRQALKKSKSLYLDRAKESNSDAREPQKTKKSSPRQALKKSKSLYFDRAKGSNDDVKGSKKTKLKKSKSVDIDKSEGDIDGNDDGGNRKTKETTTGAKPRKKEGRKLVRSMSNPSLTSPMLASIGTQQSVGPGALSSPSHQLKRSKSKRKVAEDFAKPLKRTSSSRSLRRSNSKIKLVDDSSTTSFADSEGTSGTERFSDNGDRGRSKASSKTSKLERSSARSKLRRSVSSSASVKSNKSDASSISDVSKLERTTKLQRFSSRSKRIDTSSTHSDSGKKTLERSEIAPAIIDDETQSIRSSATRSKLKPERWPNSENHGDTSESARVKQDPGQASREAGDSAEKGNDNLGKPAKILKVPKYGSTRERKDIKADHLKTGNIDMARKRFLSTKSQKKDARSIVSLPDNRRKTKRSQRIRAAHARIQKKNQKARPQKSPSNRAASSRPPKSRNISRSGEKESPFEMISITVNQSGGSIWDAKQKRTTAVLPQKRDDETGKKSLKQVKLNMKNIEKMTQSIQAKLQGIHASVSPGMSAERKKLEDADSSVSSEESSETKPYAAPPDETKEQHVSDRVQHFETVWKRQKTQNRSATVTMDKMRPSEPGRKVVYSLETEGQRRVWRRKSFAAGSGEERPENEVLTDRRTKPEFVREIDVLLSAQLSLAATRIQAVVRGGLLRLRYKNRVKEVAPEPLQAGSRADQDQASVEQSRTTLSFSSNQSKMIKPSFVRGNSKLRLFNHDRAATKIQAMVRGGMERLRYCLQLLQNKLYKINSEKREEVRKIKTETRKALRKMKKKREKQQKKYAQEREEIYERAQLALKLTDQLRTDNKKISEQNDKLRRLMKQMEKVNGQYERRIALHNKNCVTLSLHMKKMETKQQDLEAKARAYKAQLRKHKGKMLTGLMAVNLEKKQGDMFRETTYSIMDLVKERSGSDSTRLGDILQEINKSQHQPSNPSPLKNEVDTKENQATRDQLEGHECAEEVRDPQRETGAETSEDGNGDPSNKNLNDGAEPLRPSLDEMVSFEQDAASTGPPSKTDQSAQKSLQLSADHSGLAPIGKRAIPSDQQDLSRKGPATRLGNENEKAASSESEKDEAKVLQVLPGTGNSEINEMGSGDPIEDKPVDTVENLVANPNSIESEANSGDVAPELEVRDESLKDLDSVGSGGRVVSEAIPPEEELMESMVMLVEDEDGELVEEIILSDEDEEIVEEIVEEDEPENDDEEGFLLELYDEDDASDISDVSALDDGFMENQDTVIGTYADEVADDKELYEKSQALLQGRYAYDPSGDSQRLSIAAEDLTEGESMGDYSLESSEYEEIIEDDYSDMEYEEYEEGDYDEDSSCASSVYEVHSVIL